jgi:ATP synthase protein I
VTDDGDGLLKSVRMRRKRHWQWRKDGEPSLGGQLAQIGVLGWMIVLPTLIGTFFGRWVDRRFGTGIFWTAPMMIAGLALGCRAAWRWMHGR